jgi:hypothetical protein
MHFTLADVVNRRRVFLAWRRAVWPSANWDAAPDVTWGIKNGRCWNAMINTV